MSDTPVYDEVAAVLGEPGRSTPCVCEVAPDDCVLHPQVRFAPAAAWPGRECSDPPWETCSDAGCPQHGDTDEPITLAEAFEHIAEHLGTTAEDVAGSMYGLLDTALGRVDPEVDRG